MAEDANSHLPAMCGIPVTTNANHRVCVYSLHKSRQLLARRHYWKVYVEWMDVGRGKATAATALPTRLQARPLQVSDDNCPGGTVLPTLVGG